MLDSLGGREKTLAEKAKDGASAATAEVKSAVEKVKSATN
jgi:hypothetical protein